MGRFAIMEYGEKCDFIKVKGMIATFTMLEAKKTVSALKGKTGYDYTIIFCDSMDKPVHAADCAMITGNR